MKIAIWHNLPSGGGKRALYGQVKGLLAKGHELESWCPSTASQEYLPLNELIKENILPFDWFPRKSNRFMRDSISKYMNEISKLRAIEDHCRQCAREINERDFDLVLANPCLWLGTPSIARFINKPTVTYLHEPNRRLYEARPELSWIALKRNDNRTSLSSIKRYFSNLIEVQSLRVQAREELSNAQASDMILVNSLFSRESILRTYGIDAKVCYLGIDTNKFKPKNVNKENFVIGVGEFSKHKNIEFLIKSIACIEINRPRLVWIGNNYMSGYLEELKKIAEDLNVCFEPKIMVSDVELKENLNKALALVCAPRLEPFGLVVLEANACGLPVVGVNEGGLRETIEHGVNGLLVDHDEQTMADTIQQIIDDPGYAKQLGNNGRRIVEDKWPLDKSIDRFERQLLEFERDRICRNDC